MDNHKNFAYGVVAVAPSPATSGTTLEVSTGQGALFPTAPFNCTVWPAGTVPLSTNAEIIRVTTKVGDVFTIQRAQEGTTARTIIVGDQIANTITVRAITDVEEGLSNETSARAANDDLISNAVSIVSNALSAETVARVAGDNTQSNKISIVSNALSVETAARVAADDLISQAVSVVSHAVSVLSHGNSVDHAALSSRIDTASALGGTADAHASTASLAATSADTHANTASAAATSVNARVNSVNIFLSGISALSVGGVSTHGIQSVINALSGRIDAVTGGSGSVTSNEASAISNTASANNASLSAVIMADVASHLASTSALIKTDIASVSAAIRADEASHIASTSATIKADIASVSAVLATSIQTASAAATSVDGRVNSVNTFVSGISSRSVGDISTHGLQSVVNALSGRIDAVTGGSVTSNELSAVSQTASAANASLSVVIKADINSVSAAIMADAASHLASTSATIKADINSVSAAIMADAASHLASTSAVIKADIASVSAVLAGSINTASAAATSVDGRIASLSAVFASISVRTSVGGATSIHGLQSVFNALSNQTSDLGTSIRQVSADFVANDASVSAAIMADVASHLASTSAAIKTDIASVSAAIRADEASHIASTSATIKADINSVSGVLATSIQTASAAATSVDGRVNSVNTFISGISSRSVGNVSTHGFQSIINALSGRIDNVTGGSVTSNEASAISQTASANNASLSAVLAGSIQTASAAATSVDSRIASLSAGFASLSVRSVGNVSTHGFQSLFNALSTQVSHEASVRGASVQTASAAATSVDGRVNSVNTFVSGISARSVGDVSTHGFQSVVNALSGRIAAVAGGSVTSNEVSAVSAQAASALSDAISAGSVTAQDLSLRITSVSAAVVANYGAGQFKIVTGAQAIATATFTKVSGLSLSISGSGFYEVHGQLVWSQSGAGSASAIFNFGMSMTAQPVMAMFRMQGNTGAMVAAGGLSAFTQFGGNSAICATPSIMYSAKPNPGVSGSVANTMFFDGILQASTAQSQLKVVAAASSGAFGINIQPGSWIRAYKVG